MTLNCEWVNISGNKLILKKMLKWSIWYYYIFKLPRGGKRMKLRENRTTGGEKQIGFKNLKSNNSIHSRKEKSLIWNYKIYIFWRKNKKGKKRNEQSVDG